MFCNDFANAFESIDGKKIRLKKVSSERGPSLSYFSRFAKRCSHDAIVATICFFYKGGVRNNVIVTMMPFKRLRCIPNNPLSQIKNCSRNRILWTYLWTTRGFNRDDWAVWVDQLFKISSPVESVANSHLIWFSFHPRTFANAHFTFTIFH